MSEIINLGQDLHHSIDTGLDENSIVIDAGASDGRFIRALRGYCDCLVFAIEPNRDNFRTLVEQGFERVFPIPAALVPEGNHEMVVFKQYKGKDGKYFQWGSTQDIHEKDISKRGQYEKIEIITYPVYTLNLSGFTKKSHIDLLKMDIEGEEKPILESLIDRPDITDRIDRISMEYHYKDVDHAVKILESFGYTVEARGEDIYAYRAL